MIKSSVIYGNSNRHTRKKATVVKHPDEVFDFVGLLVNKPPRHGRVALRLVFRQFKWLAQRIQVFAGNPPLA
jgi:hypothetical protein